MLTLSSLARDKKQTDDDINNLDEETPHQLRPVNSITGWDDNKQPPALSSQLSLKRISHPGSPQGCRKPPLIPSLKTFLKHEHSLPSVKTTFAGWLNKRIRQNAEMIKKTITSSQDYSSVMNFPIEPVPISRLVPNNIVPLNIIKRADEGSPTISLNQPRGSLTSRRIRTMDNEIVGRQKDSFHNSPSPTMLMLKKKKKSMDLARASGSIAEKRREELAPTTPRQEAASAIRKRAPSGCFKASNSPGRSFSRVTFMGISRLMNYKESVKATKPDNISMAVLKEKILAEKEERLFRERINAPAYKSQPRHRPIIIEDERPSVQSNLMLERSAVSRRRLEANRVSFMDSTIHLPVYTTDNKEKYQVESASNNLFEKVKVQTKERKYRPKGFLTTFRPREKAKLPSNELNIQAANSDHSAFFN